MYSFGVEGSVDTEQGVVLVKPLRPPPGPAWSNRTGQPQVVETSPPKENLFEGSRRAIAFYWSPDSSKLLWLSVPEKDDFARTGEAFEVMLVATPQNHLLRSPPLSLSRFPPGRTWSNESPTVAVSHFISRRVLIVVMQRVRLSPPNERRRGEGRDVAAWYGGKDETCPVSSGGGGGAQDSDTPKKPRECNILRCLAPSTAWRGTRGTPAGG